MNSMFSIHRFLKTTLAIAVVTAFAGQALAQSGSSNQNAQGSSNQNAQGSSSQNAQGSSSQNAQGSQQQPMSLQQVAANNQTKLGLEGYCPVCVIKLSKWVLGSPNFPAVYDGKTYFFPDEQVRQTFIANPAAYVPALGGDCTVCYAKGGQRGAGNIRFSSLHNKRLFLFPSKKELEMFNNSPTQYENADLAVNGECIVCKVKSGASVAGSAQFTAVHNGFRYQFPSDRERQEFLNNSQHYVSAAMKDGMQSKGSGSTGSGSGTTGAGSGTTGAGSGTTGSGSGTTGAGSGTTGSGSR